MPIEPVTWLATVAGFGVLAAADVLWRRRARDAGKAAIVASAGWACAALAFGATMSWARGGSFGLQFYAGYALELALSIDNVIVFGLLFRAFRVPRPLQPRVLGYGVAGAVVLRGAFIAAGGALIHFSWVFYVFGAFLVVAGVRALRAAPHPERARRRSLALFATIVPVSSSVEGDRFLVRANRRWTATPLLLALVAIELTDVVFAMDSIPAVFGVTRDIFVVATSNAFAVLGLRSLYVVLERAVGRFRYVGTGVAVLLVFMGAKMLAADLVSVSVVANLVVIAAVVAGAVAASIVAERVRRRRMEGP